MNLSPIEYIGPAPRKKKRRRNPFGGLLLMLIVVGMSFVFVRPLLPFLKAQQSAASAQNAEGAINELRTAGDPASRLAAAALKRTLAEVVYDPAYYSIPYPGGDIPSGKGMAADVVIRSYRQLGVDLQQLVHEDMTGNFRMYPQFWKMKGPDSNIDHRRVPNLQRFFSRHGDDLLLSRVSEDYQIGDVVAWRLPFGENGQAASHIGIVVPGPGAKKAEKWVVHNIGTGPEWEDELFSYEIVGHYRFVPEGGFASEEELRDRVLTVATE
ncbi:MAG: DUF1287 domain-containing protein [Verrucomicrobia bacterium]|nr:DUF1287 domain-containing protein [Verrucomicrobiota bacterium]MDA1006808.1 DUF1287 domain-containing protein [Verrucomicrobiota bacterium]